MLKAEIAWLPSIGSGGPRNAIKAVHAAEQRRLAES